MPGVRSIMILVPDEREHRTWHQRALSTDTAGRFENCQIGCSSAMRRRRDMRCPLYLPKDWTEDAECREKTYVPKDVVVAAKPKIGTAMVKAALAAGRPMFLGSRRLHPRRRQVSRTKPDHAAKDGAKFDDPLMPVRNAARRQGDDPHRRAFSRPRHSEATASNLRSTFNAAVTSRRRWPKPSCPDSRHRNRRMCSRLSSGSLSDGSIEVTLPALEPVLGAGAAPVRARDNQQLVRPNGMLAAIGFGAVSVLPHR